VITRCDHLGIQVRDIERSIEFYRDALGFDLLARFQKSEPYLQRLVGYPGVELDIAVLRIPGSPVELEILEYHNVARAPVDPATANPGTAHICLFVSDFDALHRRLRARGTRFVSDVQVSTAGPVAGRRLVYLLDPDGIRVELVEN
jgi:catechol 2,3-dioxygenase-like lactoylglutathione lyase family enzyme